MKLYHSVFKLILMFYRQMTALCAFPKKKIIIKKITQHIVFYTDEIVDCICFNFVGDFFCWLLKLGGRISGLMVTLYSWQIKKKKKVWHCRQSREIKYLFTLSSSMLVCFLSSHIVLIYLAVFCGILDLTNQSVNTPKHLRKELIMALVTCDCKTSNKLQCRGTHFNV